MVKRKLTLSIDEELLSEVKKLSTLEGISLSEIVEEYFESLVFERWVWENLSLQQNLRSREISLKV
jgi:hypothetical protein